MQDVLHWLLESVHRDEGKFCAVPDFIVVCLRNSHIITFPDAEEVLFDDGAFVLQGVTPWKEQVHAQ